MPSAIVSSWSDGFFKQEKHVAACRHVKPRKSIVTLQIDAIRVCRAGGRHSTKNTTQAEMWSAYGAEQASVIRRLRSGQKQLTVAPQTRRAAPPQSGSHIADETRAQYTCEYLAFRPGERVECSKQLAQIVDEVERRKIGYDQIGAARAVCSPACQKLRIGAAVKGNAPRIDEVAAMVGEEVSHPRINVVSVNGEAALCKKPRVNSRSRTEVE